MSWKQRNTKLIKTGAIFFSEKETKKNRKYIET